MHLAAVTAASSRATGWQRASLQYFPPGPVVHHEEAGEVAAAADWDASFAVKPINL
jgi:hypothetical protein